MNNIQAVRSAVLTFGAVFPEGVKDVYVYSEDIELGGVEKGYVGEVYWSAALDLGRGWDSELVTKEAFDAFVSENPTYVKDFAKNQKEAMQKLADIASDLSAKIVNGLELAREFGLEFDVELGEDGRLELRKAADVDWDSSSMYC